MEEEKNRMVQQRIKKMVENKKKLMNRDDAEQNKRITSGVTDNKLQGGNKEIELDTPQSSIRLKRTTSAFKGAESTQSLSINPSQKVEIDVKGLLVTVFDHGAKLH